MQSNHLVADGSSPAEVVPTVVGVRVGWPFGRLARWLPAFATILATIVLLLLNGTALTDIARFALYVVWALMLPGVLIYRSLRRVPHSLVDDLAMGTAVGFVLELAAWAVFSAAGLQAYLWAWPALLVGVFLLVPGLRRHWRTPDGYRRVSVSWAWAVAGIALAVVGYLVAATIGSIPIPRTEPTWYYLDTAYLLSLVTDSMHHVPPGSPQVAGEPLNYHWFSYAHVASSSLISGVEAPIVFLRLTLPLICAVSVVLMAVVGWRIGRRPWVGVLAATLMFATMEFGPTTYSFFGLINGWIITISPSVSYAWLSTIPLILIGVELLRPRGLRDAPLGPGAWVLFVSFAVAAAGAKATILVVLLAGFGLAGVAELIRRRFPWRPVMLGTTVAVVFLVSFLVLYKSENGGMRLEPLQLLRIYLPGSPMSPAKEAAELGIIGGAYAIYLLARLGGIPVLAWLAWRRRGPEWSITEWFLLGPVLAGIVGTQLLASTTWAQIYLIRSAWPFAALLSALGLAALVDRFRVPSRVVAGAVAGGLVVGAAIIQLMYATGLDKPGPGVRVVLPIYWTALIVVIVSTGVLLGSWLLARRVGWLRGAAPVLVVSLVLLLGTSMFLRTTYHNATVQSGPSTYYAETVTPDGIAATDWLRVHTPTDEILATNGHCPAGAANPRGQCLHLTFWLSAFTQRRTLVSGWGYLPSATAEASRAGIWPGSTPFFDPARLATNDAAFYEPTASGLADLRDRYGVNWLVVDRTVGIESHQLRDLATLRFERGDYAIYEIR